MCLHGKIFFTGTCTASRTDLFFRNLFRRCLTRYGLSTPRLALIYFFGIYFAAAWQGTGCLHRVSRQFIFWEFISSLLDNVWAIGEGCWPLWVVWNFFLLGLSVSCGPDFLFAFFVRLSVPMGGNKLALVALSFGMARRVRKTWQWLLVETVNFLEGTPVWHCIIYLNIPTSNDTQNLNPDILFGM